MHTFCVCVYICKCYSILKYIIATTYYFRTRALVGNWVSNQEIYTYKTVQRFRRHIPAFIRADADVTPIFPAIGFKCSVADREPRTGAPS